MIHAIQHFQELDTHCSHSNYILKAAEVVFRFPHEFTAKVGKVFSPTRERQSATVFFFYYYLTRRAIEEKYSLLVTIYTT